MARQKGGGVVRVMQESSRRRQAIRLGAAAWLPPLLLASAYALFVEMPNLWNGLLLAGLTVVIAGTLQTLLTIRFSPRHRMLSRLVAEGVRRRKRSTALMIVGLMIGSAIVSSSLVVGDSLDETIEGRLIESLGQTDIVVSGTDPLTRQPVWMNESRMRDLLVEQLARDDVDAVSLEIHRRAAAITADGSRAVPGLVWLAADPALRQQGAWPPLSSTHGWGDIPEPALSTAGGVSEAGGNSEAGSAAESGTAGESAANVTGAAVNEALAASLVVGIGDAIDVTWSDVSLLSGVTRHSHRFSITSIISSEGLGWSIGDQPLLLTSLADAQRLQGKSGQVTRLVISADGDVRGGLDAEPAVVHDLAERLDEVLVAEDISLQVSPAGPGELLVITSAAAGGLLSADDQDLLAEAFNESGSDIRPSGVIQVPVAGLRLDGTDVIGLPHVEVTSVALAGQRIWFGTAAGVGVLDPASGDWRTWSAGDDVAVLDIAVLSDDRVAVAHADGLTILDGDADEVADTLIGTRVTAVEVVGGHLQVLHLDAGRPNLTSIPTEAAAAGSLTGVPRDLGDHTGVLRASLAADSETLHVHLDRLLGSLTCTLPVAPPADAADCSADTDGRTGLVSHAGEAWAMTMNDLIGVSDAVAGVGSSDSLPEVRPLAASTGAVLGDSDSGAVVFAWNGSGFVATPLQPVDGSVGPIALDPAVDGEPMLVTGAASGASLTGPNGTVRLLSESYDLGLSRTLPPIAFAVDGPLAELVGEIPNGSLAPASGLAERLSLQTGQNISLIGYVAAATGSLRGEPMTIMTALDGPADLLGEEPALRALDEAFLGYLSMTDAARLIDTDDVRMLLLLRLPDDADSAAATLVTVNGWADEVADLGSSSLQVHRVKRQTVEQTEGAGAAFSALFLIFGSFVMLAGILLVINIFVMMADDRRTELGILRAIGLQRGDLRWLLGLEGSGLALLASSLGSLLGLGLARLMMWGMDQALATNFGGSFAFGWSWSSLIAGFVAGVLVTQITLSLTALVVGRRNVIATIRRLPTRSGGLPWWSLLFTLAALCAAAALAILTFLIGDSESGSGHVLWTSAGFLALFGLAPAVHMLMERLMPDEMHLFGRRMHGPTMLPRITVGGLGVAMLLWGAWTDPVRARYEPSDWSFIVLGAFLVTAGVLVLTTVGPLFARALVRLASRFSPRTAAILPTALAQPLSTPFRTSLTMGMYSLVVFAIVVLAGYSALFGGYLADLGDQASGEYEIVVIAGSDGLDLDADAAFWELGEANVSDFDSIAQLSVTIVFAKPVWNDTGSGPTGSTESAEPNESDDERPAFTYRRLIGFDGNFTEHGALPLQKWSQSIGWTTADLWAEVEADPTLAIIDATMHADSYIASDGSIVDGGGIGLGEPIEIRDPADPLVVRTVWVAGVLEEESGFLLSGLMVSDRLARGDFDASTEMVWMSLPSEVGLAEQTAVAEDIQTSLIGQGAYVLVIEKLFADLRGFFLSMFGLFRSFLGLGLSVGIAGLGVITVRNVSERWHQIGVLRAIGFQREMVVSGFLAEIAWISVLGILNGVLVGIGFHHALWDRYLREEGAEFLLPWVSIMVVAIGALVCTLLATAAPVRRASRVSPAEALRTEH